MFCGSTLPQKHTSAWVSLMTTPSKTYHTRSALILVIDQAGAAAAMAPQNPATCLPVGAQRGQREQEGPDPSPGPAEHAIRALSQRQRHGESERSACCASCAGACVPCRQACSWGTGQGGRPGQRFTRAAAAAPAAVSRAGAARAGAARGEGRRTQQCSSPRPGHYSRGGGGY